MVGELLLSKFDNQERSMILQSLLLMCQDHLLTLAPSRWQSTLLAMLANILLTSLDSSKFFSLDLSRLLHGSWHMTLALDPSDLRHMRVPGN
jgi:hypothetical protein